MTERHIACAEDKFVIISVTPDFCRVGKSIVPFDISRKLTPEKANYSTSVFVHDESVLMVDSLIDTVEEMWATEFSRTRPNQAATARSSLAPEPSSSKAERSLETGILWR